MSEVEWVALQKKRHGFRFNYFLFWKGQFPLSLSSVPALSFAFNNHLLLDINFVDFLLGSSCCCCFLSRVSGVSEFMVICL